MSLYSAESREIELEAVTRLSRYFSGDRKVVDLGHTEGYDFEIHQAQNGLIGIGEVSWLEDPIKKSAWTALRRQKKHHVIPLNVGQGFWSMSLKHSANINEVSRNLPKIINEMKINNQNERQIYETWPHDEISNSLRILGIEYLRKVENFEHLRDECFFLFEGSGGVIPQSLEPLGNFILELLNTKFRDCVQKLNIDKQLEKHLYLKMGSYLPFNLLEPLGRHNPAVDIGTFNFPEGITHVWLIASSENFRSVLWSANSRYLD